MSGPRHQLVVAVEDAGLRLDVWLARAVPGVSRSLAAEMIRSGQVAVGGRESRKASRLVRAREEVVALVPAPDPPRFAPEAMALSVLHEDDHLLVLDKPAGLVVHPAAGHPSGTLVNGLLARAIALAPSEDPRKPGIVHRLDKDTSGCLVVAKTPLARAGLEAQFRDRKVTKVYLAIVHGRAPRRGDIAAAIGRDPRDRKRMAVRATGGRAALSRFRLLEELPAASLLEVVIATGRTHQIRVHLTALGHPVVGDRVYGRQPRAKAAIPALVEFPRQALHAHSLAFRHPATGDALLFRAPLPMDMERLLDELRRAAPEPGSS